MKTWCSRCRTVFQFEGTCPNCGQPLAPKPLSPPVLMVVIIGCVFVMAVAWLIYTAPEGKMFSHIWSRLISPPAFQVSTAPPEKKTGKALQSTFTIEDRRMILGALKNGDFAALSRKATELQMQFEADPSTEFNVNDFYYFFAIPAPEYEELLNAWVASDPSHFAPYLARAQYYVQVAWEKRGADYAAKTSDEQFRGMEAYLRKASRDLQVALRINGNLLPAYLEQLTIANAVGSTGEEDAIFLEARNRFPSCSLLYHTMMWANLPRWGGSYAKMEAIAAEACASNPGNPVFVTLYGRIYEDQANRLRQEKKYDQAIELCDKAIHYGERFSYYEERARCRLSANQYDKALEDANRAIALRPILDKPYLLRASIYRDMGDVNKAIEQVRFLNTYFLGDPDTEDWISWTANRFVNRGHAAAKTDLSQAADEYGTALQFKPDLAEALYWRGLTYSKLQKSDLARADLERALELNPSHFESCRLLDYLLAGEKKWDEIIRHWTTYLAAVPDSADAYFERAGTYKHKGDMKSAMADVERACRLGKEDACKVLRGGGK